MKKAKRGRPPLRPSERASWQAMVRLPRAQGVEVEKAAAAGETTVAEWIREAVLAALRR